MIKSLIYILILYRFCIYPQELPCEKFRTGTYYAEVEEPIPATWKIIRNKGQQMEEALKLSEQAMEIGYSNLPQYETIEWLDNCSYRLRYDESRFELSETQKMINNNGGVFTQITEIEGDCYYYLSTLLINDREVTMKGKICSELK